MVTSKAQATRERILEAANNLFHRYGYHATGLEQIIAVAKITKGNFYYHFKSKEALAIATIDWHFDQINHDIAKIAQQTTSPLDTLVKVLDFFADVITRQNNADGIFGCYFGNFTLEMSNENPPVRQKLRSIFDKYNQAFNDLLTRAEAAGELAKHIDPKETAGICVSLIEGSILIDKAYQEPKEIYRGVNFLKKYLTRS